MLPKPVYICVGSIIFQVVTKYVGVGLPGKNQYCTWHYVFAEYFKLGSHMD